MEKIAVLIGVFFVLILFLWWKRKYWTKAKKKDVWEYTIRDLDRMKDGSEFEEFLSELLRFLGYHDAYKTKDTGDFGADVVFTDSTGKRTVIQAKRYSKKNPVGLAAVQEVYSSRRLYKAQKTMVISTSAYTPACEYLAGVNHVKLIDRKDLIEILDHVQKREYDLAREILESEPYIIHEPWKEMLKIKDINKAKNGKIFLHKR